MKLLRNVKEALRIVTGCWGTLSKHYGSLQNVTGALRSPYGTLRNITEPLQKISIPP